MIHSYSKSRLAASVFLFFFLGWISYVFWELLENMDVISNQTEKLVHACVWFTLCVMFYFISVRKIRQRSVSTCLLIAFFSLAIVNALDYVISNDRFDRVPIIGYESAYKTILFKILMAIGFCSIVYALFLMLRWAEKTHDELAALTAHTNARIGDSYFPRLMKSLSEVLNVEVTMICTPATSCMTKVKIVSLWVRDHFDSMQMFELENTPCEVVYREQRTVFIPDKVQVLYPKDKDLVALKARSYVGIPLFSSDGNMLGHLVLINSKKMKSNPADHIAVQLIAQRTAAELERRQIESKAKQADQLASLGNMAAGIAHEINNPLWMITLKAEEIKQSANYQDSSDKFKQDIEHIEMLVDRCSRIVNSLLMFARKEKSPRWVGDMIPVIWQARDMVRNQAESKQVEIAIFHDEGLPKVEFNPTTMEQVFVNILQNAIDASPVGKQIEVSCYSVNDHIRITIIDHGVGIDPEQIDRVFDPFYTSRLNEGGTGLGLSISHRIIEEHGGEISIESDGTTGTRVSIEIPVSEASYVKG